MIVTKRGNLPYEELAKVNMDEFKRIHQEYTERGRAIVSGAEVILTDWAIQNGLSNPQNRRAFKVRNSTRYDGSIAVKWEGNQQASMYWAGFWKLAPKSIKRKKS